MDGLATLADSPTVFEQLLAIQQECERSGEAGVIARLRILAVANKVCGAAQHNPQQWWWALYEIRREIERRRCEDPDREESVDLTFAEEAAIAVERFDEWWQRLCAEPADDTDLEPPEELMSTTTRRRQQKTAAAEHPAGWRCLQCGCDNPAAQESCGTCEEPRGTAASKRKSRQSAAEKNLEHLANGARHLGGGIPETQAEAAAKEDAAASKGKPPKRKTASQAKDSREKAGRGQIDGGHDADVPLVQLHRRTDNPRQKFDDAKQKQLAESIQDVGLLSRIVVRQTADGYELWAGERRVRACESLGWGRMPAKVFRAGTPDSTMEAIRAWENLQREDLDPIEEARSLQQLLASGAYASQKELGAAIGLSQGEVSLRLRVTALPADWQAKVIAHEISTSHAKHLYPYLDLPAVLKKVAQAAAAWRKSHGRAPSERDFQTIVQNGARAASKPIGKGSDMQAGCPFSVSQALRAELDVRPVPQPWGSKPEPRAFNVTLWNQKAKEAKQRAKKKAKAKPPDKRTPAAATASGPRSWDVEERVRIWAQQQIAERLQRTDKKLIERIFLTLVFSEGDVMPADLPQRLGVKVKAQRYVPTEKLWPGIAAADDALLKTLPYDSIQHACTSEHGHIEQALALAIARTLGADPETDWRPTAADLDVYSDQDLVKLAKTHGYDVGKAKAKKAIVAALVKVWKPGDLPQAFRDAFQER